MVFLGPTYAHSLLGACLTGFAHHADVAPDGDHEKEDRLAGESYVVFEGMTCFLIRGF